MTTMNEERAAFEDWLGITPCGAAHVLAYEAFKAGTAWQRAQGAVLDVSAMAKVLSDRSAEACNIDRTDNWAMYGQEYIEDVRAMLAAAPAQPAVQGNGDQQEELHVWRATTRFGETCHFGEASTARAWAGENGTVERVELTPVPELRLVERQEQEEVQRLREMLERATKLLSAAAGYATKMEPMPAKLLNAIDTALDACPGQEVGK